MSMFNYNDAEPQRGDIIPDGTIARINMKIRPGGAGEGGWLKRSKAGDKEMLDIEYTVLEGPHARRKFWGLMVVSGSEKAEAITRSTLRGVLESARGIKPTDMSEAAQKQRVVSGYGDFDGIEFMGKIGIEKSDGYADKNKLVAAVTPGMRGYEGGSDAGGPQPQHISKPLAGVVQQATKPAGNRPAWAS